MKADLINYEGHNYIVIPIYHNSDYTKKDVYHVLTSNESWAVSKLPVVCGYPKVQSKVLHDVIYKQHPTIENALHPYWEATSHEDDTYLKYDLSEFGIDSSFYYEFTYVEPYDD